MAEYLFNQDHSTIQAFKFRPKIRKIKQNNSPNQPARLNLQTGKNRKKV